MSPFEEPSSVLMRRPMIKKKRNKKKGKRSETGKETHCCCLFRRHGDRRTLRPQVWTQSADVGEQDNVRHWLDDVRSCKRKVPAVQRCYGTRRAIAWYVGQWQLASRASARQVRASGLCHSAWQYSIDAKRVRGAAVGWPGRMCALFGAMGHEGSQWTPRP